MMNQQKTNKAGLLKYSLIVPLALALILSSNAQSVVKKMKKVVASTQDTTVVKVNTVKAETQKSQLKASVKATAPTAVLFTAPVIKKNEEVVGDKPYDVVEKMPQYPGGETELLSYIAKNLKYPVIAQESGTQGMLIVRFVINKEGKVTNASIIRSMLNSAAHNKGVVVVGYARPDSTATKPSKQTQLALENEALRVINAMPQWTPGEQNDKKVSVWYTLPIKFKLE